MLRARIHLHQAIPSLSVQEPLQLDHLIVQPCGDIKCFKQLRRGI